MSRRPCRRSPMRCRGRWTDPQQRRDHARKAAESNALRVLSACSRAQGMTDGGKQSEMQLCVPFRSIVWQSGMSWV